MKNGSESIKRIEETKFWERVRKLLPDAEQQSFLGRIKTFPKEAHRTKLLRFNKLRDSSLFWREFEDFWQTGAESLSKTPVPPQFLEQWEASLSWGAGLAWVQERASYEIVQNLNLKGHERVLDLCAAPGSKASAIGELLDPEQGAWLFVNDKNRERAQLLEALLLRQACFHSSVYSGPVEKLQKNFSHCFDVVLLDAPCSGESLFFKRKELRKDVSNRLVLQNSRLQKELLSHAKNFLKPGGLLVYATCTYSQEENEQVVQDFLTSHKDFALEEERRWWPHQIDCLGGYCAQLRAPLRGDEKALKLSFSDDFLKRHSLYDYQKKISEYGFAMSRNCSSAYLTALENFLGVSLKEETGWSELSVSWEEALGYLKGQVLEMKENFLSPMAWVTCQGMPLGPAKNAQDRFNNRLPKNLRSSKT